MKKIINPISTSILEKEINKDTFVRKTNYCDHDIYIVDYHNHPNATMEIATSINEIKTAFKGTEYVRPREEKEEFLRQEVSNVYT
ncbi:hypothetical protein N9K77_02180 [bacterium]|nr:hypothetical protein [bacterium]